MDFLDLHTHKTSTKAGEITIQSLSLTDDVFLAMPKKKPISIGLHPWYASIEKLELHMKYLTVLAKQDNVKMIGECGLDKVKGDSIENQLVILEQQINLAQELKKPVILHCVKAFDEIIELKNRLKIKIPMIIHGFNKNETLGRQMLGKEFLLSFGAAVLKEGSAAAKLIKELEFFFLETDDSQASIEEVYQAVAKIKNISIDELKQVIFANWKKLNLI
jgi:TatD DNase family protein